MRLTTNALAGLVATVLLSACNLNRTEDTYTLYRGDVVMRNMRMHVATFDASETPTEYRIDKASYNYANCVRAARVFEERRLVAGTRYWCEVGKYKK